MVKWHTFFPTITSFSPLPFFRTQLMPTSTNFSKYSLSLAFASSFHLSDRSSFAYKP